MVAEKEVVRGCHSIPSHCSLKIPLTVTHFRLRRPVTVAVSGAELKGMGYVDEGAAAVPVPLFDAADAETGSEGSEPGNPP